MRLASVADALGALAEGTRMVVAGEVAQVLAIAAACDLHHVDETVLVEGSERWLPGGADGTPDIGEFVAAELAVVLGVSPQAAVCRIASVLNVRHRHPALWQAVCSGDVRFFEAARVADACVTAGLDQTACLIVDRHCAVACGCSRGPGCARRWIGGSSLPIPLLRLSGRPGLAGCVGLRWARSVTGTSTCGAAWMPVTASPLMTR